MKIPKFKIGDKVCKFDPFTWEIFWYMEIHTIFTIKSYPDFIFYNEIHLTCKDIRYCTKEEERIYFN